jgi:uncharacterized damage-inducible protein DinB
MTAFYRTGALGALMDEYERAALELVRLASNLTDGEFEQVRDQKTRDEDCRSILTIMHHVVRSGYGYADYIRSALSMASRPAEVEIRSGKEVPPQIRRMLDYTAETLEGRWGFTHEQIMAVRIKTRWGGPYDLEQLLEHAIVHILRHRRQIERFLAQEAFR